MEGPCTRDTPPPAVAERGATGAFGGGCSCDTPATHSELRNELRRGCSYTVDRDRGGGVASAPLRSCPPALRDVRMLKRWGVVWVGGFGRAEDHIAAWHWKMEGPSEAVGLEEHLSRSLLANGCSMHLTLTATSPSRKVHSSSRSFWKCPLTQKLSLTKYFSRIDMSAKVRFSQIIL